MIPRLFTAIASASLAGLFLPSAILSQTPDSARYRIYLTITDSLTRKSAKASFGFHPRATLAIDPDTLFGFKDHWYENDSPWVHEYPSPPLGFFEELRINNYRQKFTDNGLLFGNIHAYTGPSMVDTFIVGFNGDKNAVGDSEFVFTHPQILSWPSVLRFYADSIILRDVSNNAQTVAGPYVRIDLTKDSTFTYFGDTYLDTNLSIYRVDPLHKGFFLYVYHPKISPGPPDPVALVSPANGSTGIPMNETLQWSGSPGASSYKVELDSSRTFSHPVLTDVVSSNSEALSGLALNTWYYWRVLASSRFGVSYYQDPPDSFMTSSTSGVKKTGGGIPRGFELFQNYPNPFNPSTRMEFSVSRAAHVRITVYDVLGRSVATLALGDFTQGFYSALWNGANEEGSPVPSGIYYARMVADPYSAAGRPASRVESAIRMVVLK